MHRELGFRARQRVGWAEGSRERKVLEGSGDKSSDPGKVTSVTEARKKRAGRLMCSLGPLHKH